MLFTCSKKSHHKLGYFNYLFNCIEVNIITTQHDSQANIYILTQQH